MNEYSCPSLTHVQPDPIVRHCPECGETVNRAIHPTPCSAGKHANQKWNRNRFCSECGKEILK